MATRISSLLSPMRWTRSAATARWQAKAIISTFSSAFGASQSPSTVRRAYAIAASQSNSNKLHRTRQKQLKTQFPIYSCELYEISIYCRHAVGRAWKLCSHSFFLGIRWHITSMRLCIGCDKTKTITVIACGVGNYRSGSSCIETSAVYYVDGDHVGLQAKMDGV